MDINVFYSTFTNVFFFIFVAFFTFFNVFYFFLSRFFTSMAITMATIHLHITVAQNK